MARAQPCWVQVSLQAWRSAPVQQPPPATGVTGLKRTVPSAGSAAGVAVQASVAELSAGAPSAPAARAASTSSTTATAPPTELIFFMGSSLHSFVPAHDWVASPSIVPAW